MRRQGLGDEAVVAVSAAVFDARPARAIRRPAGAVRACAFFAFALFAAFEYDRLTPQLGVGRELLVAGLALASGLAVRAVLISGPRRGRGPLAALTLLCALLIGLALVGVPASLAPPWRWPLLASHLAGAVGALGHVAWPLPAGHVLAQQAVGAGLVVGLLVAAVAYLLPTARADAARRAGATVLLAMLATAGLANAPVGAWRAQGVVLAVVVLGLLYAPSVRAIDLTRALAWALGLLVAGLVIAPLLSGRALLVLGRGAGSRALVSFEWNELYGPLEWPRSSTRVLAISGTGPTLVKVTTLDRFDGVRFLRSDAPPDTAAAEAALARAHPRWVRSSWFVVSNLDSRLVATLPGATLGPSSAGGPTLVTPDGNLVADQPLAPGTTYRATSYVPRPSVAELRADRRPIPTSYLRYTAFALPSAQRRSLAASAALSESRLGTLRLTRVPARRQRATIREIEQSAYGPVYALARSLAAGRGSEYAVVQAAARYLLANYRYDLRPPAAALPLASFLLQSRRGYCQQFSGAMALLMRMDGIPARVGVGFHPRFYQATSAQWIVRAQDAHAWTEVFFSGIGWVSFDVTAPEPAGAEHAAVPTSKRVLLSRAGAPAAVGGSPLAALAGLKFGARGAARRASSGAVAVLSAALAAVLLALAWFWLRAWRRLRREIASPGDASVAEIAAALSTLGERTPVSSTLASVAARLDPVRDARALEYLRLLGEARYADRDVAASALGREALRRALGRGRRLRSRLGLLAQMPPLAQRRRR